MQKISLACMLIFITLFAGCLEIEESIVIKEDGSGTFEIKTDMGSLLAMAGQKAKEDKIIKDTVLKYDPFIDTAQSLSDLEKSLLRKTFWKIRLNSTENIFDLTLVSEFTDPIEINQLMVLLARWDNIDMLDIAMQDFAPGGGSMGDLEKIGSGKKMIGDMTRDYYKLDWQIGKFTKVLDSLMYKKIGEDENLNSFKKLGEIFQDGEVLEKIIITTKFVLPRAAVKAEGKNLSLSEDRAVIKIKASASDIYNDPHSFEYEIEY